jgi:hypothetical protein
MTDLHTLIEQTIVRHIEPFARVVGSEPLPTPERDRAFGMAAVARYRVAFEDRSGRRAAVTLLVKDAPLNERRVLELLTQQGLPGVPYAHALDTTTNALAPVCQRDLAPNEQPLVADSGSAAVERLARIHAANLGRGGELAWLPRADRAYFEGGFVLTNWREQWDETMRMEEFARTWGPERPRLEAAAARFLADMDQLWAEGASLTLIHADLHNDHVLIHGGEPYFIDWGQARYGSFYLDLPNYFAPDDARHYRKALADFGYAIGEAAFMERYRMAGRYVGFKYMGYTLWSYREGYTRLDRGQWNLFDLALNGR